MPSWREINILNRIREPSFDIDKIIEYIKIKNQTYILGKGKNGWKITFDDLTKTSEKYIKILEGGFTDNGNNKNNSNKSSATQRAEYDILDDEQTKQNITNFVNGFNGNSS